MLKAWKSKKKITSFSIKLIEPPCIQFTHRLSSVCVYNKPFLLVGDAEPAKKSQRFKYREFDHWLGYFYR